MNSAPADLVAAIEDIITGDPASETLRWLASGFALAIDTGTPLAHALGITERCPQGLSVAVRRRRFAKAIGTAALLLTGTAYSRSRIIAAELKRLRRVRSHKAPRTAFETHLMAALAANPDGPASVSGLWPIVDRAIAQHRVHTDGPMAKTGADIISGTPLENRHRETAASRGTSPPGVACGSRLGRAPRRSAEGG